MTVLEPIGIYHCPLKDKFGLPRQAGVVSSLKGEVSLLPPFDGPDAVRGLDGFDYIWLIWGCDSRSDKLTVRPPRLGGNIRMGVFATRSPLRPNPLGLSCVRLEKVGRGILHVSGADLADGTEIFDIKPYIEYSDSRTGVRSGFVDGTPWQRLSVELPDDIAAAISEEDRTALTGIIAEDPRPRYQDDPGRIYGLRYMDMDLKFRVEGQCAFVVSLEKI